MISKARRHMKDQKINALFTKCLFGGKRSSAFTIVEIIVVVIVIGILASITIVSYAQITNNAKAKSVMADAAGMRTALVKYKSDHGVYPASLDSLTEKPNISSTVQYSSYGTAHFCLLVSNSNITMYVSNKDKTPQTGTVCTAPDIQTVLSSRCPSTMTVAIDARDNHTYWVRKLADGKCWMLTNLAYAGGGNSAYADTKTISDGTSDTAYTYTDAKYYIPFDARPTTAPTQPSASTDGGATNKQYGYHYNWCAATGVQPTACSNSAVDSSYDTAVSICPAGWRLPSSSSGGGDFQSLVAAIGATNNAAGATVLRSTWLSQYSGSWLVGFSGLGGNGYFWSSTQNSSSAVYLLNVNSSTVNTLYVNGKYYGISVRCVAV